MKKDVHKDKEVPSNDPWRLADLTAFEKSVLERVEQFTMTGPERIISLIRATEYVVKSGIEGDFVECGVWKGGSAMAMACALQNQGVDNRRIFLYDTFEGMSQPTSKDRSLDGISAEILLKKSHKGDARSVWCYSTLEDVKSNMSSTSYPEENIHYVMGKVEETIPNHVVPEKIALLRLDTDWYESTKHELEHLFPRLQKGGVLIIDDYGHWEGCRKAVDEYLHTHNIQLFLNRIDYTCRLAIKM